MKHQAKHTSVILAIVLQLAPMARQLVIEFIPNVAVIFRWGVGLSALLGGIDAVSGASQGQIVAPKIAVQPAPITVAPGKTVHFKVKATGGHLHYQWLFNVQPIPGATHKSLTLHHVQAANTGDYSVIIRNTAGTIASTKVALSLNPAPASAMVPIAAVPGGGAIVGLPNGSLSWLRADGTMSTIVSP